MSTADGGCGHATACEVTHHQPVQTEPRKLSPKPLTTAGITRQPVQSEPRELRPPHATRAKAEPPSPAAPAPEPAICGSYYGQELNMSPIATERMKADGFTGTFQILGDDEYSHNPFQLGEVEDLTEEGSTEQSPDGRRHSKLALAHAGVDIIRCARRGRLYYVPPGLSVVLRCQVPCWARPVSREPVRRLAGTRVLSSRVYNKGGLQCDVVTQMKQLRDIDCSRLTMLFVVYDPPGPSMDVTCSSTMA